MKVLGFGDCCIDYYLHKRMAYPGGNAFNMAAFCRECGAEAAFLGTMGTDDVARHITETARSMGIDISHCPIREGHADRAAVDIVDGNRVFEENYFKGHGVGGLFPPKLRECDLEYAKGFDLIHGSCYAHIEKEFTRFFGLGPLLSFDFSCEDRFRSDDYLEPVCQGLDVGLFSCEHTGDAEILQLVKRAQKFGCRYILITLGAHGQRFYADNRVFKGKAEFIEPVDTMGAGDSFFAAFLVSLLKYGWKKGGALTKEMIHPSLAQAAGFSTKNCLVEGSFGHGFLILL